MIEIFAVSADSTANDPLVRTMIQMIAYVTPFFLIPATFKFGLGVFGNLAGRINDRSRGFFDKQRKHRQEVRAGNISRMKTGERFNNRALNSFTSHASTPGIPFTRRRREAYQQKINNSSAAFAKSEQAQGIQHNDGALRALTYGSAMEAREKMAKDFGMSQSDVESSIAAARAAGGFGRNRQVWAAQQLAATGTGYDDISQLGKTIARVSHGNTSQAAALAGNINSSTKSVGRFDLAPGFGKLNALAQSEMAGGASEADYHAATVAASRGADPVTLLRGKPTEVRNLTTALDKHLETQTARMQDTSLSSDDRAAAALEVKQTMGQIAQLNQSKSYASQENQMLVNELVVGSQPAQQQAMTHLQSQPNAAEHLDDLQRFSAPPQYANDPRNQPDK